jgi:hypothetical protein
VKQHVYTCCRCDTEQRTSIDVEGPPIGWALVTYRRDNVLDGNQGEQMIERTMLTTHACSICSASVLAFLEKTASSRSEIDSAFDDGGAP